MAVRDRCQMVGGALVALGGFAMYSYAKLKVVMRKTSQVKCPVSVAGCEGLV